MTMVLSARGQLAQAEAKAKHKSIEKLKQLYAIDHSPISEKIDFHDRNTHECLYPFDLADF